MAKLKIYKLRSKIHRMIMDMLYGFIKKPSKLPDVSEMDIKVLIVSLDYIGDYCMRTIPVIHLVKNIFQRSEISVLAGAWSREIVKTNPYIKTVAVYNPAWLDRNVKKWNVIKKIRSLLACNRNKYDLIIDVRGSMGVSIWYLFRPAPYIVRWQDFIDIVNKKCPDDISKEWKHICMEAETKKKEFMVIPQIDKDGINNMLTADGIDLRKKVISIHPSTHSKIREWLPDRWAATLDRLVSMYNVEIIICGDAKSKECAAAIISKMKSKAHNFAGKTTLLHLAALIAKSNLCISIDSGPMHIAGLLDVPVIGLFGPNNKNNSHPLTTKCRLIFKDLPCTDCIEHLMSCRAECMKAITCEDVIKAANELDEEYNCL